MRGVKGLRDFCKEVPGGAMWVAMYLNLNTETTVYNWMRRGTIPKKHRSKAEEFLKSEGRYFKIWTTDNSFGEFQVHQR